MANPTSGTDRFMTKARQSPFVPIGIAGSVGMLIYGLWGYSRRGSMPSSVYLMHLRVKAQGMIVGVIAIGTGASLVNSVFRDYDVAQERVKHTVEKKMLK